MKLPSAENTAHIAPLVLNLGTMVIDFEHSTWSWRRLFTLLLSSKRQSQQTISTGLEIDLKCKRKFGILNLSIRRRAFAFGFKLENVAKNARHFKKCPRKVKLNNPFPQNFFYYLNKWSWKIFNAKKCKNNFLCLHSVSAGKSILICACLSCLMLKYLYCFFSSAFQNY